MAWFLIGIPVIVAVGYAFARPWLIEHSLRWRNFCAWLDPIAAKLWDQSRSILISRLYWLGGILLGLHDWIAEQFSGQDWTPIIKRVLSSVPEDLMPLALAGFIAITGILFEWLRHLTTRPVADQKVN